MWMTRTVLVPMATALLMTGSVVGQDGSADTESADPEPGHSLPLPVAQRQYEVTRPCIGAGYIPYSYPAVGSCPCIDDFCFSPHRCYCCGMQYKRAWCRKWIGSHLGHRSMLDDYHCACIFPTAVPRPYLRELGPIEAQPPSVPPADDGEAE